MLHSIPKADPIIKYKWVYASYVSRYGAVIHTSNSYDLVYLLLFLGHANGARHRAAAPFRYICRPIVNFTTMLIKYPKTALCAGLLNRKPAGCFG
jgi:hypothetical protein